ADFRSLFAFVDISAVVAFPSKRSVSFESISCFECSKNLIITFLVSGLYLGNKLEFCSKLIESFCSCFFSHGFVHFCPLIVFAGSSVFYIFCYITDAVELFEPHFCVFFLLICCFFKDICNLNISGLFCLGSIKCVFVSCLRLTGKCSHQVLFCFGSFVFCHL